MGALEGSKVISVSFIRYYAQGDVLLFLKICNTRRFIRTKLEMSHKNPFSDPFSPKIGQYEPKIIWPDKKITFNS